MSSHEQYHCVTKPITYEEAQHAKIIEFSEVLKEGSENGGVSVTYLNVIREVVESPGELVVTTGAKSEDYIRMGIVVPNFREPFDYWYEKVEGSDKSRRVLHLNYGTVSPEQAGLAGREVAFSTDPLSEHPTWMGAGLRSEQSALSKTIGFTEAHVGQRAVSLYFSELAASFDNPTIRSRVLGAVFHAAHLAVQTGAAIPPVPELADEVTQAIDEYNRRIKVCHAILGLDDNFNILQQTSEKAPGAAPWIFDRPISVPSQDSLLEASRHVGWAANDARQALPYAQEALDILLRLRAGTAK